MVLATLPEEGGRVRLTQEQAQSWLRALNDVRLALGAGLDVTEDRDEMLARVEANELPRRPGCGSTTGSACCWRPSVEALW